MGGKTKQSQRTKNNVRPSSSGRSALLLSNVKLESGLMNLSGQELPGLFPTLVAPNIDPLVSPELQLCIKKLNKKDPITKTKALQELSELVSNSKVDDIVAALPSWAHFYKILTADPDRKVREATQSCHGTIVSACGRRVAPHLKQLMPAWLQAQYDEHAPAQTNAQNSLAKTFPDNKLPEVISFCKSEVVAHLLDNLRAGADAAFIRKTDTPEEKEAQLARIVTSSLHGVQYTAQHLPAAHHDWLWAQLAPLFQANTFWKRAAHSDSRIRAAWYAALGRVVARYKRQFAAQFGRQALRVIFAGEETNPLAAAQLWDCVLLFMYNVEDWYKYLDKKELLNKRILDVLESGGWGDARHLSNMLLPLLAHLPPAVLNKEFYVTFFDAIFNGLDKKTILSSKSERQSWITSLDECLRYVSIQQQDYVLEIVTSVHRTWLEKVLSDTHDGQIRTNLIKYSANSMAALVKYWLKQAKEGNSEKYDQLIRNFWQNVGSTIMTQIDKLSTNHTDIGRLIDGHIMLLQTLKTSFIQEAKKHHSIKFDGDSPTVIEKSPKEIPQCDAIIVERYHHNLNDLVQKICGHYLEFAGKKQISSPVLTPLITVLGEFGTRDLFAAIAIQFDADSTYKFYDKVLRSWLAGDTMRCKAVIDIVFLFLKHLSESEQDAVFDSFKQFPPSVVEWCICLSLSHPHCLSPSARRWMRGALVEASVASICTRVTELGDSKAKNLLLMCLNNDASGEMVISEQAVSIILSQLSGAVAAVEKPALELVAALAARLATTLAAPGLPALVLALFRLSVLVPRGSERLSVDTWCEVRAAWQDGLQALAPAERAAVLAAAAALVHRHLLLDSNLSTKLPPASKTSDEEQKTDQSLDMKQMEHVVSLCPYLLSNNSQQDVEEVASFSRRMLSAEAGAEAGAGARRLLAQAVRMRVVRGELSCPLQDDVAADVCCEPTKEALLTHLNNCIFRTMYLKTILLHRVDEDLEDTWCDDLLCDDYFVKELCVVMHDYMVIYSMSEFYGFWPHYILIKETKEKIDYLIAEIINECTTKTRTHLLNALAELAATKGYYWSFARRWFEINAKLDKNENYQEITENCPNETASCEVKTESIQSEAESSQNEKESNQNEKEKSSENVTKSSPNKAQDSKNQVENVKTDCSDADVEGLDLENMKEIVTGNGYFHTLQANDHWRPAAGAALRTKFLVMVRGVAAAHGALGAALAAAAAPDAPAAAPDAPAAAHDARGADALVDLYYAHNHVMLYETDITEAAWSEVASNAAIMEYLAELVTSCGWDLPAHQWDFTTITLCHALTSALKSKEKWGCTKVALFTRAALKLFLAVEAFVRAVRGASARRQPAAHVAHLPHEWTDIFAPDLFYSLFSIIMYILETSSTTTITANHIAVLDVLIESARRLQWELVPAQQRRGACALRGVAARACAALGRPAHYCHLYLAYELLRAVHKPLVLEDAEKLAAWSGAEDAAGAPGGAGGAVAAGGAGAPGVAPGGADGARERPLLSLLYYEDAFRRLQDMVEAAVGHVKVCEATCSLVPFSDVHLLALGWLLLGEAQAAQARLARGDLQHHYVQLYREHKFAEPLLRAALRLLPADVFARARDGAAPLPRRADLFARMEPLHVYEYCAAHTVSAAACRGVALCVRGAGAGDARGWRGAAPHKHARLLDNIVRGYITPNAVKEEFLLVQQRASELEDTEISLHWSTYELTCILTVEERPIELKVTLSREHPLGLPRFVAQDNAPTSNTNWLVMYMGYQNGTLLNALKMWTAAVNSKVERSAQCYICYCRLHFSSGRLPSVLCQQCRNKFHTDCLRKWFRTSNKSNCPLCRTSF